MNLSVRGVILLKMRVQGGRQMWRVDAVRFNHVWNYASCNGAVSSMTGLCYTLDGYLRCTTSHASYWLHIPLEHLAQVWLSASLPFQQWVCRIQFTGFWTWLVMWNDLLVHRALSKNAYCVWQFVTYPS